MAMRGHERNNLSKRLIQTIEQASLFFSKWRRAIFLNRVFRIVSLSHPAIIDCSRSPIEAKTKKALVGEFGRITQMSNPEGNTNRKIKWLEQF